MLRSAVFVACMALIVAVSLSGCSLLAQKKRYALDVKCSCPTFSGS